MFSLYCLLECSYSNASDWELGGVHAEGPVACGLSLFEVRVDLVFFFHLQPSDLSATSSSCNPSATPSTISQVLEMSLSALRFGWGPPALFLFNTAISAVFSSSIAFIIFILDLFWGVGGKGCGPLVPFWKSDKGWWRNLLIKKYVRSFYQWEIFFVQTSLLTQRKILGGTTLCWGRGCQ